MSHKPTPPQAPCRGCSDRTIEPNCHMTCERYLAFANDLASSRKKKQEADLLARPINHEKRGRANLAYRALTKRVR